MTKKQALIKEVWTKERLVQTMEKTYHPTDIVSSGALGIIDLLENTLLIPSDSEIFKHLQELKQVTLNWD